MRHARIRNAATLGAATVVLALAAQAGATGLTASQGPPFDLDVALRDVKARAAGRERGRIDRPAFGHVAFRQPVDADKIIYLDTSVHGLTPNHSYVLQRAVDTALDGQCTSADWLTLGRGLVAHPITTDERGTGHADLFRDLSAIATGTQFDIHFRVIDAVTREPVLASACYRFVVGQ
jgi:hypothetical protein